MRRNSIRGGCGCNKLTDPLLQTGGSNLAGDTLNLVPKQDVITIGGDGQMIGPNDPNIMMSGRNFPMGVSNTPNIMGGRRRRGKSSRRISRRRVMRGGGILDTANNAIFGPIASSGTFFSFGNGTMPSVANSVFSNSGLPTTGPAYPFNNENPPLI